MMQETDPSQDASDTADALDRLNISEPSQWLPEWMLPIWDALSAFPLLAPIVIIGVGFLLARVVTFLFKRTTSQLTSRTKTEIDDQIINQLGRPVFATVFYASLMLATLSLELAPGWTKAIIRIVASLGILVWTTAAFPIANLVLKTLAHLRDRYELIQDRTVPLFDILSKLLIAGLAAYALLMVWNIDPTAWLASAGVVGIAVGFAAKDTLANLFSGLFIVVDAPYKIGDFINLDSGERGMVTHVGLRSTRLLTRDDIEITIPNAVIGNAKIINETGGRWEKRRIRIKVGVAYGSDVDQVCETLIKVTHDHPKISANPAPRVRMRGFGESSLDFELLGWINQPVDRGSVTHELLMNTYKSLNEAGIEIPFPKRDLYIKEMPNDR
jgi:small-conductance mechanosensitive channel